MAYYLVSCKCAHVGRNYYMPIEFPVYAENGREAAAKARNLPRVKRHHKDAILNCIKVDYDTYLNQIDINNHDVYLLCKSRHEQNQIMSQIKSRLVEETKQKGGKILNKPHRPNLYFQSLKYASSICDYTY